ncbi:MAG TPA: MFS transporter [Alphaproteobacteria bacterium]|nr:MFS transporter [Alphaproteobacteria bacterium]
MTASDPLAEEPQGGAVHRLLRKTIDVRPNEVAALLWSCLFIFAVLCSYYVLRPIRDEMGVQGGVNNLAWLFTGTLVAMLAVNPLFSALVKKLPRRTFITVTYRFFMANLLFFALYLELSPAEHHVWMGRVFFIWASVFNLFVVSIFWAFIVDVFDSGQGKRLFGFLSAGATMGAILGSTITSTLVEAIGQNYLMFVSIALLEIGVLAVRRLSRLSDGFNRTPAERGKDQETPLGGSVLAGLTHTLRSPYLSGIGGIMLLYAITSTFLYFQQADIVSTAFSSRAERTAFFANVDLIVNVLTLALQIFCTSRALRSLGVAVTLIALPVISLLGFAALALAPTIAVLVGVQVLRRVSNFAFARPARELLFTTVTREDKYKAKSFLDTAVYRAGDQIGSWSYALMGTLGLAMAGISAVAVPISAVWIALSWWLGRRQERTAEAALAQTEPKPAPALP